eukprot:TRINITY_DN2530_c3_g1_i1.p1 TRINITY_DN2530_c3_g1~~TRINITY_DN2530_c3_g1_i1.p1  ORF type:complete len:647 (+),score=293.23 TRINITY_DN2530_c3_g1_i1:77-1942(+)
MAADFANCPNLTTIDTSQKGPALEMTTDEKRRFHECMQDPKFVELWQEYADEISDPKHLAEQEEYLKQVEREANERGDHSFTFMFPKPNFCVKLKQTGKEVVYINVCDSTKVEEPREETTGDKMASNYSVPVCMGKRREDSVESGKVTCFDAVYHPKATFLARSSDKFADFLVDIAVENINANPTHCGELSAKLSAEYTRVREPACIGNPPPQTLRIAAVKGKEGELVFDFPKKEEQGPAFQEAKPGDGGFADRLAAGMGDKKAKERIRERKRQEAEDEKARQRAEEERKKQEAEAAAQAEKERKKREREQAKQFASNLRGAFAGEQPPPAPAPVERPGSVQPKYTIVHQGEVDLGDAWGGGEISSIARKHPRNLVLRIELPTVKSAKGLDLDIDHRMVSLQSDVHNISLCVPLPYKVNPDAITAKFDKARKQLSLTLPVIAEKSAFEVQHEEERKAKLERDRAEARAAQEEEDRERREEAERKAAARKAEEEVIRKRKEAEEAERKEVEDAMEKAVAEERARREREQREREEEERRQREEEIRLREEELQKRLGQIEAAKVVMGDKELEARREVERDEGRLHRKIIRDLEAMRVAERMAAISKQRQQEVPLTNRCIFELE